MLTFEEYRVREILIEEGYDLADHQIKAIVEAGFMDRVKKFGRNAAIATAIGATALTGLGSAEKPAKPQANYLQQQRVDQAKGNVKDSIQGRVQTHQGRMKKRSLKK